MGIEKFLGLLFKDPKLITNAANKFGSQSIAVCLDVKKSKYKQKYEVFIINGKKLINKDLLTVVKEVELFGAGELIINSIDQDGMMMVMI